MPVFLALSGRHDGLSGPVTFDSIWDEVDAVVQLGDRMTVQTTLDTAVEYLVKLEQREGLSARRDPEAPRDGKAYLDRYDEYFEDYKHYFKDSAPLGPSSDWVDTDIYTEWTGGGYMQDVWEYGSEEYCLRSDASTILELKRHRESLPRAQSRL